MNIDKIVMDVDCPECGAKLPDVELHFDNRFQTINCVCGYRFGLEGEPTLDLKYYFIKEAPA